MFGRHNRSGRRPVQSHGPATCRAAVGDTRRGDDPLKHPDLPKGSKQMRPAVTIIIPDGGRRQGVRLDRLRGGV
jgi:hypothetical protein